MDARFRSHDLAPNNSWNIFSLVVDSPNGMNDSETSARHPVLVKPHAVEDLVGKMKERPGDEKPSSRGRHEERRQSQKKKVERTKKFPMIDRIAQDLAVVLTILVGFSNCF